MNGSIFYTWAKQQETIADSSAESEFIGMVLACKNILYCQYFLDELGIVLGAIPILHIDNTSAMKMVNTNVKSRVKHLDRKTYWIRDYIACSNVIIKHVDGKINLADIFTKYVTNQVLEKLRPAVMGREEPPKIAEIQKESVNVIKKQKILKVKPLNKGPFSNRIYRKNKIKEFES